MGKCSVNYHAASMADECERLGATEDQIMPHGQTDYPRQVEHLSDEQFSALKAASPTSGRPGRVDSSLAGKVWITPTRPDLERKHEGRYWVTSGRYDGR